MSIIDNINISLSYNSLIFYFGLILIILYTLFIYRTTLPDVGYLAKGFLAFIRSLSLILILVLIFDPTINISSDVKVEPKTIILLDNSKSIAQFADSNQAKSVEDLIKDIRSELGSNAIFYSFGNSISEIDSQNNIRLNFSEGATDLSSIQNIMNEIKEVSSILIVSDGIINQGIDPQYQLSNSIIPVYSIGIGDSAEYPDIALETIRNNSTIYTEKESEIEVLVSNSGKSSETALLNIFDNDSLIFTESIGLSETGINRIRLPYVTEKEGKHKISVTINPLPQEINRDNNSKSALINVLSSKKKIAVISGGPSRDLSAIVKSIKTNQDFELIQITELGKAGYYNNFKDTEKIKDADVLFLLGFPSLYSNPEFVEEIFTIIKSYNINLFIASNFTSDYNALNSLYERIQVNFKLTENRYSESQVYAGNTLTGLMGNNRSALDKWSDLPPVTIPRNNFSPQGRFDILLSDENKVPVLIANQSEGNKNIVLNCINTWRWKLKANQKEYRLFDNLIFNSIKWLSLKTDDFFRVDLNKKNYNLGEDIYFKANLYDKTFQPLTDENISLEIFNDDYSAKYIFSSEDNGIYELKIKVPNPGIYNFKATLPNNVNIAPVSGSFNIDKLELELSERKMNKNFLRSLAVNSGGKYFELNESDDAIPELRSKYEENIYFDKRDKELRLSNFELILFIILLLFSIEWIIRKSLRMI